METVWLLQGRGTPPKIRQGRTQIWVRPFPLSLSARHLSQSEFPIERFFKKRVDQAGVVESSLCPHLREHGDRRESGHGIHFVDDDGPGFFIVEEVDACQTFAFQSVERAGSRVADLLFKFGRHVCRAH